MKVLSRFDAEIHHIPDIINSAADALSRYPYVQSSEDLTACAISMMKFDNIILGNIRKYYKNDHLFGLVIKNPESYPLF